MFDAALLESRKDHSLRGRRLSLPVAVGLHLAVIAAFVGASAWFTGDAPEPVIPIVYPVPSTGDGSPPPPPGGGQNRHTVALRPRPLQPIVAPVSLPIDAPTAVEDGAEAQTDPSDSGPEGLGSRDGIDGGTGPSTGGPAIDLGEQQILIPGGAVAAPVLLQRVEPDYPEAALRAHLQGTVILEAVITTSGEVQQIRVLKAVHPLLDEAAERAVRQWRYKPATLNGRAVPVFLTVTVRFALPA